MLYIKDALNYIHHSLKSPECINIEVEQNNKYAQILHFGVFCCGWSPLISLLSLLV